jgi:hypothetical protein
LPSGAGHARGRWAAPPPHLALTGGRGALSPHCASDGMRARRGGEAAAPRLDMALPALSRWRQRLKKCWGQPQGVRPWPATPRQNTLRETDDARTNPAEKNTKSALRGSLSLDNRGPPKGSMPSYRRPSRTLPLLSKMEPARSPRLAGSMRIMDQAADGRAVLPLA